MSENKFPEPLGWGRLETVQPDGSVLVQASPVIYHESLAHLIDEDATRQMRDAIARQRYLTYSAGSQVQHVIFSDAGERRTGSPEAARNEKRSIKGIIDFKVKNPDRYEISSVEELADSVAQDFVFVAYSHASDTCEKNATVEEIHRLACARFAPLEKTIRIFARRVASGELRTGSRDFDSEFGRLWNQLTNDVKFESEAIPAPALKKCTRLDIDSS